MIRALIAREFTISLRNGPVYLLATLQVALSLLFVMVANELAVRATPWNPPAVGASIQAMPSGLVAAVAADVGATVLLAWTVWLLVTSIVVVPAIGGPTLARERERGLIDVLRGAGATPIAIVATKTLAALTQSTIVLLAALPSLALVVVFGNLPIHLVIGSGILLIGWVVLSCAVSVCCSAWARTVSGSVISAFAATLLVFLLLVGVPASLTSLYADAPPFVRTVNPIVAALALQPELGVRLIPHLPEASWLPPVEFVERSGALPWLPFVALCLSLAGVLVAAASLGLRRSRR